MMSAAKVPKCYCDFFEEKPLTMTYLDGLTVVEIENKKLT
jgi:predicted nucleic-acid-binding Zn-ribbon protein